MACPVGLRARPALAAMEAGITRFVECEDVAGGVAVRASMLMTLDVSETRTRRAAELARHALAEAVAGVPGLSDRALPCFLALPEPGADSPLSQSSLLQALREVAGQAGLMLEPRIESIVSAGRAGVFQAIKSALYLFAAGRERFALVGGIDSLVDPVTLKALAAANRLLGPKNLDGIIPGEAAAFLLLADGRFAPPRPALAQLHATACAQEPIPFTSVGARISTAQGLTAVFHELQKSLSGRVQAVFAGVTGEGFFGQEFAHSYLRSAALMPEPLRLSPLSSALGDSGAAAGAVSIVRAVQRLAPFGSGRLSVPIQTALAYASSDNGLVGGCIVTC